jgi:uncharacterized delta-60 repeat protein
MVYCIDIVNDGIIIGGNFTTIDFVNRRAIAKLSMNGQLISSFNANMDSVTSGNRVDRIKSLPNGKILICGSFTSFNGVYRTGLARLNSDGSLDTTFNAQVAGYVDNFTIQNDGKIIIVGNFYEVGGNSNYARVARLNPDGSLDTSLYINPNNWNSNFGDVATTSSGIIYIISNSSGNWNYLKKFSSTGSLFGSFNYRPGPNLPINTLITLPNKETVLIGGMFTRIQNTSLALDASVNNMVELQSSGLISQDFIGSVTNPLNTTVTLIKHLKNNKLLVAGNFSLINGVYRNRLAILSGPPL